MPSSRRQRIEIGPDSAPFNLDDGAAYGRWRAEKLARVEQHGELTRVPIAHLQRLHGSELAQLTAACRRANFAIYQTDPGTQANREALGAFARQLGLRRFEHNQRGAQENIVALRSQPGSRRGHYIPYTDQPLKWHTDGYYNPPEATVRGVVMHCVSAAREGGANSLLDPELVYLRMRDAQPAFVATMMQPDVMTIPANTLESGAPRPAVSGPVFSVDPDDGSLHMRYTARTRSIQWKDDAVTREAVAFLNELLTAPVEFAQRVCLAPGEGIVCNNVLHNREGFIDGPDTNQQRLLWRARYLDRIANTSGWQDGSL